ncbi:unnamed protein product [marine sediment metagenome]|uniref:Uncharacterized protein n=2 Tax=marine sediment metagenome TaxID=412755 RepID=X1ACV5_9ZZZZ
MPIQAYAAVYTGKGVRSLVKINANIKSFQTKVKERTAIQHKSGKTIGKEIFLRTLNGPHPSNFAASSISGGIALNCWIANMIKTGKVKIKYVKQIEK